MYYIRATEIYRIHRLLAGKWKRELMIQKSRFENDLIIIDLWIIGERCCVLLELIAAEIVEANIERNPCSSFSYTLYYFFLSLSSSS